MVTFEPAKRNRTPTLRPGAGSSQRGTAEATRAARMQVREVLQTPDLQPKLTVGPADDEFEQEAERVADQVMRMPAATHAGGSETPPIQRTCKECAEEEGVQPACAACEERVQRAPARQGWSGQEDRPGFNVDVTTVSETGKIERAKGAAGVWRVPIEGLGHGFQDPQVKSAAKGRAVALIPSSVGALSPSGNTSVPLDVLLHLHGHGAGYAELQPGNKDYGGVLEPGQLRDVELYKMEQQLHSHIEERQKASKPPLIAVLPQGSSKSDFGDLKTESDAYVKDVVDTLKALKYLPDNAVPGRLIVSGHSGGGFPASRISTQRLAAGAPTDAVLFDAINSRCSEREKFTDVRGNTRERCKACSSGEYGIARDWVTTTIRNEVKTLSTETSAGKTLPQLLKERGTRFRGFSSTRPGSTDTCSYGHWYGKLSKDIDATIRKLKLGPDIGDAVRNQLRENYHVSQVQGLEQFPGGMERHERMMGQGDILTTTLNELDNLPTKGQTHEAQPEISAPKEPRVQPPGTPPTRQKLRRAVAPHSTTGAAPAGVAHILSRSGAPLDASLRLDMEKRFDHDFSGVRLHTDAAAAQSARDITAFAYTLGEHIVFDENRYAPGTPEGRRLIAHELTHVVQQSGTERMRAPQRSHRSRPPEISRARGSTISRWFGFPFAGPAFPDVSDGDIKWIDALTTPPNILAQIDTGFASGVQQQAIKKIEGTAAKQVGRLERKKPSTERDAAIAAVEEKTATDVAAEAQRFESGRSLRRKEFLHNMRGVLGPDPATENHFKALEQVEGSPNLFLHRDAVNRLKAVRADLQSKGHDIPKTTVGQSLRGRHLGTPPGRGMLGHPLGLSIDYDAYANPKISSKVEEHGPERVALLRLMSGDPTNIKLYPPGKTGSEEWSYERRRAFIEGIGKRTMAGEDVEQDPKVQEFYGNFETQFGLMEAASQRFKQSLPAATLTEVRALKDRYEKALVALRPIDAALTRLDKQTATARTVARRAIAKRDKVKAADVADADIQADTKVLELLEARKPLAEQKAPFEAEKEAVAGRLKPVFQPWLDQIQKKIDELRAAATGKTIVLEQVPTPAELKAATKKLKELDKLEAKLQAKPTSKRAAEWTSAAGRLREQLAPLLTRFESALGTAPTPGGGAPASAKDRLEQAKTLKPWLDPAKELGVWTSLFKQLSESTEFVFGKLEGSKPQLELKAGDASVAQLLGVLDLPKRKGDEGGFFNPDPDTETSGFNLLFFKTMVKHGFDPGAGWKPGGTDPMHFDFIEGWAKFVK